MRTLDEAEQTCLGIGIGVLLICAMVFGLIQHSKKLENHKQEYLSQCTMDGFKWSECSYKWKVMH